VKARVAPAKVTEEELMAEAGGVTMLPEAEVMVVAKLAVEAMVTREMLVVTLVAVEVIAAEGRHCLRT